MKYKTYMFGEYEDTEYYDDDDDSMDSTEEGFMKGYEDEADAEFEGRESDDMDYEEEEE